MSPLLKQRLMMAAKTLFVAGLLYVLVKKGFISISATRQALGHWEKIVPAVTGLVFTTLLGVVRWQWLLRAHNIHLNWIRTFQLTLIGCFFNIALPGAVSGDFVKAFYIGKELKGQRSRAFGSILFDRVAGLSALVIVSATALAIEFRKYNHTPLMSAILFLVSSAAICVLAFYGYLFLVGERHDVFLLTLKKLEAKFPAIGSIARVYESLRHYHNHRWTVTKVLLTSVVIQLTVGWICLNLAESLDPSPLSLLSVYIIVPLGLLITAIPVAPAGVGTGNLAFLYLFELIGSPRGADVYSLYALTSILIGMFGGIIYLRFRSLNLLPPVETTGQAPAG